MPAAWWLWVGLAAADPAAQAARAALERYPGAVDATALDRAAAEGVARYLDAALGVDAHAVFTEPEWRARLAWLQGHREGLALEYGIVAGRGVVVTDVYPDGPAERAGLRRGDLVVGVNGAPLTGLPAAIIHDRVREAARGPVRLEVRRGDALLTITAARAAYLAGVVRASHEGSSPVVRVPFFGQGTSGRLRAALAGLDPAAGLVLDLRDNPGGMLEEAIACAGLFAEPGAVLAHQAPAGMPPRPLVGRGPRAWAGPVAVIVNEGTAGAAEAFAAALKAQGGAVLVGGRTAGRADLPEGVPIGDGLVMQIVGATLRDPLGRSWAGDGLLPDIQSAAVDLVVPAADGGPPPDLQQEAALQLVRARR